MAFIPQEMFGRGNEVDGSPSGYKTIYIPKQDDGIFSEFVNDYIDMFTPFNISNADFNGIKNN